VVEQASQNVSPEDSNATCGNQGRSLSERFGFAVMSSKTYEHHLWVNCEPAKRFLKLTTNTLMRNTPENTVLKGVPVLRVFRADLDMAGDYDSVYEFAPDQPNRITPALD
jgi:hypothetical protein